MDKKQLVNEINMAWNSHKPFFFLLNFDMQNGGVFSPEDAYNEGVLFNFNQNKNYTNKTTNTKNISLKRYPADFNTYKKSFDIVKKNIGRGNSYLVNLTASTPIESNASLSEIFYASSARYRLLYKNEFVVFSPETFVRIENNKIFTFPMKGTIDASIPNAAQIILNNPKEMAEHATTVDLLRNDLSRHATNVNVDRFRYIEQIKSNHKKLFQVSSQISGDIEKHKTGQIGEILFDMLPAGSVTGAPKNKTIEIIKEAETHQRGYYTGIAGFSDGKILDTCVLIRFIENNNGQLVYKSGGGITSLSNANDEYNELIDKIYVPNC